jgi:beta-galactosidase
MGNSNGDLWSYWGQIYEKPFLQGAYIWDWVDQGLRQPQTKTKYGAWQPVKKGDKTFWAYGGDFGPAGTPSDDNFCCNGLVTPDRKPHPGLHAVKQVYQSVHCRLVDGAARRIEVRNRYDFLNLKDVAEGRWVLTEDGRPIQQGGLPELDLAPGASTTFRLPVKAFKPKPGVEYFVALSFRLNEEQPWARVGYEVAWNQFALPDQAPVITTAPAQAPQVSDTPGATLVKGEDFELRFDKHLGTLASYKFKNVELIRTGLRPHFWRAQIDNDRGRDMVRSQGVWRKADEGATVRQVATTEQPATRTVSVRIETALPKVNAVWETTYAINGRGEVVVSNRFLPEKSDLPPLPRLGMQMTLPSGFEDLSWFGPGPQETYSDRKNARVGRYQGTVTDQFFMDYSEPGESGNKADARWVAVSNGKVGLLAVGIPLLSANASHYATEDMNAAKHSFELPMREYVTLNLDWMQQGLGGDDSWGAWPHKEFQIPCREYSYSFRLQPFSKGENPGELARK